jgi:hypothetical protein
MNAQTLEDIECLLEEYANAVRTTTRANIDAGRCATREDFKHAREAKQEEEAVLSAILVRLQEATLPPKRKMGVAL